MTRNGASIITRTILAITAAFAASCPIDLPAATTCATSCTVEPIYTPNAAGVAASTCQPRFNWYSKGYRKMAMVPNTTTVETATVTSSLRPLTTGSVAITAAAPQMELPAPIRMALLRSSLNTLVPRNMARPNVDASTSASMAMPARPTWPISWKVKRKP